MILSRALAITVQKHNAIFRTKHTLRMIIAPAPVCIRGPFYFTRRRIRDYKHAAAFWINESIVFIAVFLLFMVDIKKYPWPQDAEGTQARYYHFKSNSKCYAERLKVQSNMGAYSVCGFLYDLITSWQFLVRMFLKKCPNNIYTFGPFIVLTQCL